MGLSIRPKLTMVAPLGALTQKRTVPEAEIEPLNVVLDGSMIGICDDEAERVNAGAVVAKAEGATIIVISSNVNAVNAGNLVLFIFPT